MLYLVANFRDELCATTGWHDVRPGAGQTNRYRAPQTGCSTDDNCDTIIDVNEVFCHL